MPRRLALVALTLLASACDSGSDVASLVGTWDATSGRNVVYVTSSEAQSARVSTRPGEGGLVVTGAVAGTLRYFYGPAPVTAYDFGIVSDGVRLVEDIDLSLTIYSDGLELVAHDPVGQGARSFYTARVEGPPLYTVTADYIEVRSVRFVEAGTGAEATVTGRLTFARVPLEANRETLLSTAVYDPVDAGQLGVAFDEGGAYRWLLADTTQTGTWAPAGDGAVSVRLGEGTRTYTYDVDGPTLTLSFSSESGACAPTCPGEGIYGLAPGTLLSSRAEFTQTFRRGD